MNNIKKAKSQKTKKTNNFSEEENKRIFDNVFAQLCETWINIGIPQFHQ